jgi:hypothetical protein
MYHYVYKLVENTTGEFYFGSRSCNCHPSLDNYMGSMRTWKPNKNNLVKTIIKDSFIDRGDCISFERELIIRSYKDPLNRNYHIPSTTFETCGTVPVIDIETQKYIRLKKNDILLKEGAFKLLWEGRKHTEESKQKMSESAKTRRIIQENELKRREGISKNNKKPKNDEHKKHIREAKLGSKNPMYNKVSSMRGKHYEKEKCAFCGREVSRTKINLFHNENCKYKNK